VNALEAIKGPCKIADISLEEGFAEALLEKLSPEETDVELTYLQVFLDRLFRLAQIEKSSGTDGIRFNVNLFQKTGDVSDLLGSFLEEQLKELEEPDTGLTILKSFVSSKGTKRQLTEEEVFAVSRSYGKDIPVNIVSSLLQKFVNIRILRDKDDNGRYELRHDSLAAKIYEKITIVEKEMMEIYQFLENALTSYQKRKVLLNANDLKYIAPYEDRLYVNKEIGNLIDLSKKELNKGKKRIKRAAIGGFVAIMIISFAAIMKIYGWPMGNVVRKLGYLIYIVWFLPLFIFYVVKTRENRTINVLFLIFTLFFLGYNYIFRVSVQASINVMLGGPFNQTGKQIQYMIENYNHDTDSIYDIISQTTKQYTFDSVDFREIADELRRRSNEIHDFIQNLKVEIVTLAEGPATKAINDRNINFSEIKKLDERNLPSMLLIGPNANGKAFKLKELLADHKEYLKILSDNNPTILKNMNNLLNLNDHWNLERNEYEMWENYNFQTKNLGFTLITLSQFQQDIKYVESEVMTYLYNRMLAEIKNASVKKKK
jgi:hypothetical protein